MSESRATVVVIGSKPLQKERRVNPDRRQHTVCADAHGPDFAFLANSIPQLVWTSDASG